VLGALASAVGAAALGGCSAFDQDEPRPEPPDPLAPLLADTVALLGRYDAALATQPDLAARLRPVRQAHAAHAAELARLIGATTPGPSPAGAAPATAATGSPGAPADARGTLAALRAAEVGGRRAAAAACLAAPPERAALLGSIAAARATHAEALA
jgi:hypothetical protein